MTESLSKLSTTWAGVETISVEDARKIPFKADPVPEPLTMQTSFAQPINYREIINQENPSLIFSAPVTLDFILQNLKIEGTDIAAVRYQTRNGYVECIFEYSDTSVQLRKLMLPFEGELSIVPLATDNSTKPNGLVFSI